METLRDACHAMPGWYQTIKGKKQLSSFHVDSSSLFMGLAMNKRKSHIKATWNLSVSFTSVNGNGGADAG